MNVLQKYPRISPFLWFDNNAEEAVNFYLSIFKNSSVLNVVRSPIDGPSVAKGNVMTIAFELDGQKFTAMNGGPYFKFNEAISWVVRCETQAEIDDYWTKLTAGGSEVQCGWLKDKYGLSWQIVPATLPELIQHPKAMQAMMQMKKLIIADLESAATS